MATRCQGGHRLDGGVSGGSGKDWIMNRQDMLKALVAKGDQEWDFCIIGGGATGLGVAVDAASRGFSTVLVEQYDFAKGRPRGPPSWCMEVCVIYNRAISSW